MAYGSTTRSARGRLCIVRLAFALVGGLALLCTASVVVHVPRSRAESGAITVHNTILGQTTTYIGATEGGYFDAADLTDCGINTYRIWIGMSDVEYCDDDDPRGYLWGCDQAGDLNYGTPTSAATRADTNVISWTVWDEHINDAAYRWRTGNNPDTVFGSMVSDLQANGILPVLTLRNRDEYDWPAWAPNPPISVADLEEWWQYCFAVAYWFNVRNSYGVTHFEVHNEPDLASQGWGGNEFQYAQLLVPYAYDAVKTANDMAGIETYIHAPVVANYNSAYVADSLDGADDKIQVVDYHTYANDPTASIAGIKSTIATHNPDGITETVWVSEWGTYSSSYDTFTRALLTADQLFTFSEQEIQGVNIFTFYDWGGVSGLVKADGTKTETYYAYRLMTRGLVGGKERLDHTPSGLSGGTRTMVTRDAQHVYVIVLRDSVGTTGTVSVDMTAIGSGSGTVTVWEYSAANKDVVVETPVMTDAAFTFTVPADGIALVQVDRSVLATRVSKLEARPVGWLWVISTALALASGGAWLVARWRQKRG